jgi:hypothetical protein
MTGEEGFEVRYTELSIGDSDRRMTPPRSSGTENSWSPLRLPSRPVASRIQLSREGEDLRARSRVPEEPVNGLCHATAGKAHDSG